MLPTSGSEQTSLLTRLEVITNSNERITGETMIALIEADMHGAYSATEWSQVVEFAARQNAKWQTAWLFSSANAPDLTAKQEMELWSEMWGRFTEILAERAPSARDEITRQRELTALQHALSIRTEMLRSHVMERFMAGAASRIGILLDRLGMPTAGRWLYRRSLYPPGTVGRSDES